MSATSGGGAALPDYRPAVEVILRQHGCSPRMRNGQVELAPNGSEKWWFPVGRIPILLPTSIPSAWAANNVLGFLGLKRIFR
jgi:hypothetical protein